jgi:predicted ribosome quality control (RQC) complex YloA/Tae2 family protein
VSTPASSFDAFTLAAVAAELRNTVIGARVQKVQQPADHDLVLSVYGRAGAQRILLSADPKAFRVHLTQRKRENPVTAPAFCQLCRKHLEGAFVESVTLPRFDRVLRLGFRTHDGERAVLVAELMGRNANLILISGAGVVRGTMRPAPADSERPLRLGKEYADPPGFHNRVDPLTLSSPSDSIFAELPSTPEEARNWLSATFSGIGRFAAEEILARAEGEIGSVADALYCLMEAVRAEQFAPHTIAGSKNETVGVWAFEPLTVPPGRRHPRESISVALDTLYATTLAHSAEEASEPHYLASLLGKASIAERRSRRLRRRSRRRTAPRSTSGWETICSPISRGSSAGPHQSPCPTCIRPRRVT